jgi:branched-subunit amino acid aminotransferase/4-amino-4-deoxychorismate lyase
MSADAPVLLETMRLRAGEIPLLELHRHRLLSSCRILGIPTPTLELPKGGPDRVVRAEVSADAAHVSERPLLSNRPVSLVFSRVVHEPYRHKSIERTQFDRTLEAAREAGADDGILLTKQGHVAETGIWALYWWEGTTLCAPPLGLGILPAVSRVRVNQLVGPVLERRVTREELEGKSLLVSNAARGVVAVSSLEGKSVPEHPETLRLQEAFWP